MLWKRKRYLNFPSNVTCIYWLENCYLVAACSFSSPHFECKSEGAFWINIIFLIMIDYNTTHNNKNASTFPNVAENHPYLFQEFQEESFFAKIFKFSCIFVSLFEGRWFGNRLFRNKIHFLCLLCKSPTSDHCIVQTSLTTLISQHRMFIFIYINPFRAEFHEWNKISYIKKKS